MIAALIFLSALGLSLALTPLVRSVALRAGLVDRPDRRKMHHMPVPLLGGAAIVLSFMAVVLAVRFLAPELFEEEISKLPAILGGAFIILMLGVYDDWRGARAPVKLVWQLLAAAIVVFGGVKVGAVTNPMGGSLQIGWLGIPITILWIVGVTNALNLIDGLDGLAAGISTLASLSLCAVASITDEPLVAFSSLALAGATLGFLPFNLYPARIFLGDTGSMFLGFILASLGAVGSLKSSASILLVLPIVVLGIPVFDTVWAILRRTHRRVSPFKPDREHIHHRLVKVGLHHRHVVLVLYFISAFLGLSAFIMVQLPYETGLLFAVLLAMGGGLGVWTLKYIEEQLERRAGAASSNGGDIAQDAAYATNGGGRRNGVLGRGSDSGEVEIAVCAVGRFRAGLSGAFLSNTFEAEIREALARRLKISSVGLYLNEAREAVIVLRIQPLGPEARRMIGDALLSIFRAGADRLGDGPDFPRLRWLRLVDGDTGEEDRLLGADLREPSGTKAHRGSP